jgi:hypothetical protein
VVTKLTVDLSASHPWSLSVTPNPHDLDLDLTGE